MFYIVALDQDQTVLRINSRNLNHRKASAARPADARGDAEPTAEHTSQDDQSDHQDQGENKAQIDVGFHRACAVQLCSDLLA